VSEHEGTYAALMELQQARPKAKPEAPTTPVEPPSQPPKSPAEDITTTPYISQNYRFTEDELRWLRHQAFKITEKLGTKVSQNAILRIALGHFRRVCEKNPRSNPLIEAVSRLKK
jgi:hypothetical protein